MNLQKIRKNSNDIKYNYTRSFDDKRKSGLGKYYTPEHLVELVYNLINSEIKENTFILDMAAGCGAFLERFEGNPVIARDIDEEAVEQLKILGFENVGVDNSLENVNRGKYGLSNTDHLCIIGNPPYNDVTSKNKKYGKNTKEKIDLKIDSDLKSNDYGISFFKAFNKLNADAVCVLHPLSYLIKKANFRKLGDFPNNYVLKKSVVFSSREFIDTAKTPFPVSASLFCRGSMDYDFIKKFKFDILNSHKKFVSEKIETIDGYIRKYPPRKKHRVKSDIGLYMYNIRDINSLISSGNLTEKENFEYHVTVDFKDLYKYAYLNSMKRNFGKDFLFGNISPIVDREALENNDFLKDAFLIDTIINNQRIPAFNIKNNKNVFFEKSLIGDFKRKHSEKMHGDAINIYQIFFDFVDGKNPDLKDLKDFIKEYFLGLKNRMLENQA